MCVARILATCLHLGADRERSTCRLDPGVEAAHNIWHDINDVPICHIVRWVEILYTGTTFSGSPSTRPEDEDYAAHGIALIWLEVRRGLEDLAMLQTYSSAAAYQFATGLPSTPSRAMGKELPFR
jgi:hypothetical protein